MLDKPWVSTALILLGLLFANTASGSDQAGRIASSQTELIGTWGNSEDGGKTFWGFDEYRSDGSVRAWGNLPDGQAFEAAGVYQVVFEAGQKKLCIRFVKVSEPLSDIENEIFCNIILSVDTHTFVFKDEESGEITTLYRR